jgi:hypothetical protein
MSTSKTVTAAYQFNGKTLTVNSSLQGVPVTATTDANGQGNGMPSFTRLYATNTDVILIAPSTALAANFVQWIGCDPGSSTTCNVHLNTDRTVTAVYDWTFCANESGTCSFTGTQKVRYGAGTTYATPQTATNSLACTNVIFGDPIVGTAKHCDYQPLGTTPPSVTTWRLGDGPKIRFNGNIQ